MHPVALVSSHKLAQLCVGNSGSAALLLALGCLGIGLDLPLWLLSTPHLRAPLEQSDISAHSLGKASAPLFGLMPWLWCLKCILLFFVPKSISWPHG